MNFSTRKFALALTLTSATLLAACSNEVIETIPTAPPASVEPTPVESVPAASMPGSTATPDPSANPSEPVLTEDEEAIQAQLEAFFTAFVKECYDGTEGAMDKFYTPSQIQSVSGTWDFSCVGSATQQKTHRHRIVDPVFEGVTQLAPTTEPNSYAFTFEFSYSEILAHTYAGEAQNRYTGGPDVITGIITKMGNEWLISNPYHETNFRTNEEL